MGKICQECLRNQSLAQSQGPVPARFGLVWIGRGGHERYGEVRYCSLHETAHTSHARASC